MKHILCYGDSNTWGFDPITQERFARDVRWTGVLRQALGDTYEIIEEGLNGRTTVWDDPIEGYKNGQTYLTPCLESHWPLDLVVIMLGTNDLKTRFNLSAFDIAQGACAVVNTVLNLNTRIKGAAPRALLMAPPPIGKLTLFAEMFQGAEEKSRKFAHYYKSIADESGCAFFDTSTVIASSDLDGIHLEQGEHSKLGYAVAGKVQELIG
ncbi:MAG: SGNH/GDSL hydrolase family protein [Herpetosiphon sp.]